MDGESGSPIWSRIARLFHGRTNDSVEQAIIEAREDGELDAEEGSMLLNILSLDDTQVQDIMTPRTDIDCVEVDNPLAEVIERIVASGHSRIPIYRDNRDNIVGVVYAKDLLRCFVDPTGCATPVADLMREPYFVPETKNVYELLQEFRSRKNHMAIVLDEYGGTSGLVTIEDVLELIVGDIEDEHDTPRDEDIVVLDGENYQLSGRALLEDLEELGISLDSDEVDTIGGYLSMLAGHVPQAGEAFDLAGRRFEVVEADAKQIRTVRVGPLEAV
ncbi:hemolysin family protein [Nitratidesulfovibrio sp. 1201_IL3209]|uniref:hemolysin family protein n=1 Tax=Nitratidesulfovibrio sp. 1201_IL3209 TaxID=3084053 RepID=UPI002FD9E9BF